MSDRAGACPYWFSGVAPSVPRNTVFGAIYVAGLWTSMNVAEVARRYVREFVERLKLRTTMGFYFSPSVLERVLKTQGQPNRKRPNSWYF